MGEITIRLKYNIQTGKKDIFIGYESEEDRTGYEHELQHRQIVQDLLGKGILAPEEAGTWTVERIRPEQRVAGGTTLHPTPLPDTQKDSHKT